MGTRSTITILDEHTQKPLLKTYCQYDGYPEYMGKLIKKIIGKAEILNGFSGNHKIPTHFNGMGCLAAYLVKRMKKRIGNFYISPIDAENQEYNYILAEKNGVIEMIITDGDDREIFKGLIRDFKVNLVKE